MTIMATADAAPVNIQRADFMAIVDAVFGCLVLLLSGWMVFEGSADIVLLINTVMGVFWLSMAGYSYLKPEQMDRGTEPAPALWFKIVGAVVVALILGIVLMLSSGMLL